jgi:hypothetical protein
MAASKSAAVQKSQPVNDSHGPVLPPRALCTHIKHFSFTSTPPQPMYAVSGRSNALESLSILPLQANDDTKAL